MKSEYPWTLWAKYPEEDEFLPEESFKTLEQAKSARDSYKEESPEDKFKILPT
jgi:hypothetical protein